MRLLLSTFTLTTLILLNSCDPKGSDQRIVYDEQNSSGAIDIQDVLQDTNYILVAQLPVHFDSTSVLITPIGLTDIRNLGKSDDYSSFKLPASKSKTEDYAYENSVYANIYKDNLSGIFSNLIFENYETSPGTQHILTDKLIQIRNISYLRDIARRTGKHYLLYWVYDTDTNKDGVLNHKDICALYMSELDGKGFTRITQGLQEITQGKLIPNALRYYFNTVEDSNKNGKFDKNDNCYYYYIDFAKTPHEVVNYNPITMVTQNKIN